MNLLARRISVNFQPRIPISIGSLLTAHNAHEVRNHTIVPILAPALSRPAAMGKLT